MAPARPVQNLECGEPFRRAAGKVIWTRFDEMMSYRDAALHDRDGEGVHDMRVSTRRLRAAIELFRDVFPRHGLTPLLNEVKDLADMLGRVRDLDVMLARLQSDASGRPQAQRLVLRTMMDDLERERKQARRDLKSAIADLERSEFSRRFLSFIALETM